MGIKVPLFVLLTLIAQCSFAGKGINLPLTASITLPETSDEIMVELSENNKVLRYDDKASSFKPEIIDVNVTRTSESFDKYSIELAQNSSICDNDNEIVVGATINGIGLTAGNKVELEFETGLKEDSNPLLLVFPRLEKGDEAYSCEGYITLMISILN